MPKWFYFWCIGSCVVSCVCLLTALVLIALQLLA